MAQPDNVDFKWNFVESNISITYPLVSQRSFSKPLCMDWAIEDSIRSTYLTTNGANVSRKCWWNLPFRKLSENIHSHEIMLTHTLSSDFICTYIMTIQFKQIRHFLSTSICLMFIHKVEDNIGFVKFPSWCPRACLCDRLSEWPLTISPKIYWSTWVISILFPSLFLMNSSYNKFLKCK